MKLHFAAHHASDNQEKLRVFSERYGNLPIDECDVIVAIGGDGFMLQMVHEALIYGKPVYGMKGGTLGFLMNPLTDDDNLIERIETAVSQDLHPIRTEARTTTGGVRSALAFNEVVLQRASRQAAKIRLFVDDILRVKELVCDGVMLATPAGSTAYNFSVYGPILPIGANVLALTPIGAFRPRRWRGAILPHSCLVRFEVLTSEKRPTCLTADHFELDDIQSVELREATDITVSLLYDRDHPLPERILSEQFAY